MPKIESEESSYYEEFVQIIGELKIRNNLDYEEEKNDD